MRVVIRYVCTGSDQRGWVAQMTFGGHHAKEASDKLQKKLQEEAMADKNEKSSDEEVKNEKSTDEEKLEDGLAGMNILGSSDEEEEVEMKKRHKRELEDIASSVASSAASMERKALEQKLAEAEERAKKAEQELELKKLQETKSAEGQKKYQPFHKGIVTDPDYLALKAGLQKKSLTFKWWVSQLVDDLVKKGKAAAEAKAAAGGPGSEEEKKLKDFKAYKDFVSRNPMLTRVPEGMDTKSKKVNSGASTPASTVTSTPVSAAKKKPRKKEPSPAAGAKEEEEDEEEEDK